MKIEKMNLWNTVYGECSEIPEITAYIPDKKEKDCAVVILPGGGYCMRAEHEGKGYAEFFAKNGIISFVADYRVSPHRFPIPLADSRRAIQFVRHFADKYGINKNKIAIMGSSAGGHLAALTSTYFEEIGIENKDEIDSECFIPNAQILCYPVIKLLGKGVAHLDSGKNLLDDKQAEMGEELSPDLIVSSKTPKAFVWHTFADDCVNVINSIDYVKALKGKEINSELHIFPDGTHGIGLADSNEEKIYKYDSKWSKLLLEWLDYIEF